MTIQRIARRLDALGNDTRLEIYRTLGRAGPAGLPVGALQEKIGGARSTLSHHLHKLIAVNLVYQVREKTTLNCHVSFDAMNQTLGFLTEQCCADASDPANGKAEVASAAA